LTDIGYETVWALRAGLDALKKGNILPVMPVASYCILLTDGQTFRPSIYRGGIEIQFCLL